MRVVGCIPAEDEVADGSEEVAVPPNANAADDVTERVVVVVSVGLFEIVDVALLAAAGETVTDEAEETTIGAAVDDATDVVASGTVTLHCNLEICIKVKDNAHKNASTSPILSSFHP